MKEETYLRINPTVWVGPTLGYFAAARLSPSGSGEPYKGKGSPRGYLIVEVDDKGEEKIDQHNAYLSIDELLPILQDRLAIYQEKERKDQEDKIKNLPYKNIIDLRPMIQEEITRASEQYGFKTTDDLDVVVVLEEHLELVVRIGLV